MAQIWGETALDQSQTARNPQVYSPYPFWYHPRIVSFPHVAALTVPESCTAGIAANYQRMQKGEPLENVVDLERGY